MKSLICTMPGKFEYQDIGHPVLGEGYSLLKIKRIGICGTDLHAFEGTQPYFEYPLILGHELSAEYIAGDAEGFHTGEPVTFIPYFYCGKCIACRTGKENCCQSIKVCGVHIHGGMVEYLTVPSYALIHGEGLSFDELALIEPLAIGAHGVRKADVRAGEFVLVMGAGPIGLGIMEFARIAGACDFLRHCNGLAAGWKACDKKFGKEQSAFSGRNSKDRVGPNQTVFNV
jgi:threonine dehydrogenase-like Zn-dependent dehydrogenase